MKNGLLFHSLLFCSLSLWLWIILLTFLLIDLLHTHEIICITLTLASLASSFDFFLLAFQIQNFKIQDCRTYRLNCMGMTPHTDYI